jgi:hypothetical protein
MIYTKIVLLFYSGVALANVIMRIKEKESDALESLFTFLMLSSACIMLFIDN